ncbi:MAG: PilN domain-containing protein [Planctomycetota bacterium]
MTESADTNDRRQSEERRTGGDRRRQAEGRRVVIEICRSELHLAIIAPEARGDGNLLMCRSHTWRIEAASLLAPGGDEELRLAIKQLVVEERLAGAAATVVLNGDLCVSRVAIGASSAVDAEVNELNDRSQLYLALGAGEKAAATCRVHLDARHEHAVLSVANQQTVDAVVIAAEAAGLELKAIEASAVALCRAHGELYQDSDPVLLVLLDESSVEIVVSHQGRLLLEHRPSGRVGPEQVAELLQQHHGRLERYCRRQTGNRDATLCRAYLAGDPALISTAEKHFTADLPVAICRFTPERAGDHFLIREAEPGPEHAAVLGGALSNGDCGPNLLERWIAESRKHIRPLLIRSAAPLVATLLVAVCLWLVNLELGRENGVLSGQLSELATAQTTSNKLRRQLIDTKRKIDQLQLLAEQTPHAPLGDFVGRVGCCLPTDVWLDQVQLVDGRAVVINGSSYTESGAYDFVSHLNRAPAMDRVALEETRATSGPAGPTTAFRVKAGFSPEKPASKPKDAGVAKQDNRQQR